MGDGSSRLRRGARGPQPRLPLPWPARASVGLRCCLTCAEASGQAGCPVPPSLPAVPEAPELTGLRQTSENENASVGPPARCLPSTFRGSRPGRKRAEGAGTGPWPRGAPRWQHADGRFRPSSLLFFDLEETEGAPATACGCTALCRLPGSGTQCPADASVGSTKNFPRPPSRAGSAGRAQRTTNKWVLSSQRGAPQRGVLRSAWNQPPAWERRAAAGKGGARPAYLAAWQGRPRRARSRGLRGCWNRWGANPDVEVRGGTPGSDLWGASSGPETPGAEAAWQAASQWAPSPGSSLVMAPRQLVPAGSLAPHTELWVLEPWFWEEGLPRHRPPQQTPPPQSIQAGQARPAEREAAALCRARWPGAFAEQQALSQTGLQSGRGRGERTPQSPPWGPRKPSSPAPVALTGLGRAPAPAGPAAPVPWVSVCLIAPVGRACRCQDTAGGSPPTPPAWDLAACSPVGKGQCTWVTTTREAQGQPALPTQPRGRRDRDTSLVAQAQKSTFPHRLTSRLSAGTVVSGGSTLAVSTSGSPASTSEAGPLSSDTNDNGRTPYPNWGPSRQWNIIQR